MNTKQAALFSSGVVDDSMYWLIYDERLVPIPYSVAQDSRSTDFHVACLMIGYVECTQETSTSDSRTIDFGVAESALSF